MVLAEMRAKRAFECGSKLPHSKGFASFKHYAASGKRACVPGHFIATMFLLRLSGLL
jgi:hypothetical protein